MNFMGYSRVLLEMGGNDCDFVWKDIAENPDGGASPQDTSQKNSGACMDKS